MWRLCLVATVCSKRHWIIPECRPANKSSYFPHKNIKLRSQVSNTVYNNMLQKTASFPLEHPLPFRYSFYGTKNRERTAPLTVRSFSHTPVCQPYTGSYPTHKAMAPLSFIMIRENSLFCKLILEESSLINIIIPRPKILKTAVGVIALYIIVIESVCFVLLSSTFPYGAYWYTSAIIPLYQVFAVMFSRLSYR